MIWSVVNAKGGVGKTTTVMLFAAALCAQSRLVRVLDADPQGSASAWAAQAAESGPGLGFPVSAANSATLRTTRSRSDEIVLVDTPPGDGTIITAAMRVADVVIIPTDTSGLDMARTWATFDAAAGTPRIIVLVKAEPHTSLFKASRSVLDQDPDAVVLDTVIPRRQAIKRAYGSPLDPKLLVAATEIVTELLESLS